MQTEDVLRHTIQLQRERFVTDFGVPVFEYDADGTIKVGIEYKDNTKPYDDWLLLLNNPDVLAEIGYLPKHKVNLHNEGEDNLVVEFYLVDKPEKRLRATIKQTEPNKLTMDTPQDMNGELGGLKQLLHALELRVRESGKI
jgi:hypothetical protein